MGKHPQKYTIRSPCQETEADFAHLTIVMQRYRFITPHRTGKWYPDLDTAKRFACEIGAGFLDSRTGRFVAYVGTRLEVMKPRSAKPGRPADLQKAPA